MKLGKGLAVISNRSLIRIGVSIFVLLTVGGLAHQSNSDISVQAAPGLASATPDANGVFHEDFVWEGNHGATVIKDGGATKFSTVWWNEDAWDVRQDTGWNSISDNGCRDDPCPPGENGGDHVDIHRSVDDLGSAVKDNSYVVGGDGSTGVGIMHLDFEGAVTSRLRNPMIISQERPGIVEFRTTNFVTTGIVN